ncbi:MAG TPA: prolyl oligopeptidase family serine peptidase [Streptosporangiaceae bacterium]|nr:prolyl oligopeptidase family serine peptidase [Streptosporangiaceae bacterium]
MTDSGSLVGVDSTGQSGSGDAQVQAEDPRPAVPFGEWPSPVTAADIASAQPMGSFPTVRRGDIWWQVGLPTEGGRTTVMHSSGSKQTMLLPAPWNARTRVHEYGGLSYLPVPRSSVPGQARAGAKSQRSDLLVFANFTDQRLYLGGPGVATGAETPAPITPDPVAIPASSGSGTLPAAGLRFADFVLSPDGREVWCVQERHEDGKVSRAIVAVPLDGSAADNPEAIRTLVDGWDFFAYPTPSPDGQWLAWICWNHPHMPWDGTELRVAPVEDGKPGRGRLLMGSQRESVLAPLWRDNAGLYVATDWPGWWNIYQLGLSGEPPLALFPADEDFAGPLWQLGARPFALLGDGRLAITHGAGASRLAILDPESFELKDVDTPFEEFGPALSADGDTIAAVAGGPLTRPTVVKIEAATGKSDALQRDRGYLAAEGYLPVPQHVDFEGPWGQVVHALLYPPTNPEVTGPADERPPYVVWVHGGPTGRVTPVLDLAKAYFTSRGIGIIDVNYGGSSGYGRRYRERLRREWGVVDVQDAIAAAMWVADSAGADRDRLAIRGGSAGGWTTLAAVTTGTKRARVFSAAASLYGVSDLRDFAAATHDFESHYLDGLIGPLPGFETVYEERAPVGHVNAATCPILLLQGLDDPVVPPAQSESIAADLAAHGIKYAYIAFEGESHGFRKAETVAAALAAELSFYGQILGFEPPGVAKIEITAAEAG